MKARANTDYRIAQMDMHSRILARLQVRRETLHKAEKRAKDTFMRINEKTVPAITYTAVRNSLVIARARLLELDAAIGIVRRTTRYYQHGGRRS